MLDKVCLILVRATNSALEQYKEPTSPVGFFTSV